MGNRRDRTARHGTDPSAGIRALRLEQLFREELNSILDGELGDQRFDGVRITHVELSRDGSRARIWYSMTSTFDNSSPGATHAAFAHAAGYFRTRLCDALPLKRAPELSFRHDPAALGAFNQETSPSCRPKISGVP
jgi:ribosome-binding factor A